MNDRSGGVSVRFAWYVPKRAHTQTENADEDESCTGLASSTRRIQQDGIQSSSRIKPTANCEFFPTEG